MTFYRCLYYGGFVLRYNGTILCIILQLGTHAKIGNVPLGRKFDKRARFTCKNNLSRQYSDYVEGGGRGGRPVGIYYALFAKVACCARPRGLPGSGYRSTLLIYRPFKAL